jgi:hypothetical protein
MMDSCSPASLASTMPETVRPSGEIIIGPFDNFGLRKLILPNVW